MSDTAVDQWLEQHRTYTLQLLHHLIEGLGDLHGYRPHALTDLADQRRTLGHAAAEMAQHLEHLELHHTPRWQVYRTLAANLDAELAAWHHLYEQDGAEAVRQHALGPLEEAVAALEHPLPPPRPRYPQREDGWHVVVGSDAIMLQPLLHAARDAVAAVLGNPAHQHDGYDDALWAAAHSAWADLAQLAERAVHTVHNLTDYDRMVADENASGPSRIRNSGQIAVDLYERQRILRPLTEFARVWQDPGTRAAAALGTLTDAHTLAAVLHELTGLLNQLLVNLGYEPAPNAEYGTDAGPDHR